MYIKKSLKLLLVQLFILFHLQIFGQEKLLEIQFKLLDTNLNYISEVSVQISNDTYTDFKITDEKGNLKFTLEKGIYEIEFFHIGYKPKKIELNISNNKPITIILEQRDNTLDEVIITATESKGLQTKSVINRKAMEHLQPSSFADLMELLPGGKSQTPNLTSNNRILIREFGKDGEQYNTSSLGVQFVIDDNVWNTNADMQTSLDIDHFIGKNNPYMSSKRYTTGTGVDMRTLSTNDIESVEIIRGIPGVSYGDLTSGLVIIKRRHNKTKWQGRIKADAFSKMYYIAKGFEVGEKWNLNVSLDYLNSKVEPRNIYENFQRITSSIRSTKRFDTGENTLLWSSYLDYNGNIDNNLFDPDTGYNKVDKYKNSRHRVSLSNNLDYAFTEGSLFKNIKLTTSIRQGIEDLKQTKFVQYNGPTAISTATKQGVNDGYFPEISYITNFRTEGRPIDINTKIETNIKFNLGKLMNNIQSGIDYKYSKNNGRGQIYDLLKPPQQNMTTRPRAFSDIPAFQNLAFYADNRINYEIANNNLTFYAGIRLSKLLGLNSKYKISNKVYFEPRLNFQWSLPDIKIVDDYLKTEITLGYGTLYKQPTLLKLYPNKIYKDLQQLNFYHPKEHLRYVNFMTYVEDLTNTELTAAKNIKKEIRIDFSYANNNVFFTYFDEKMPTGYRNSERYRTYSYNRYNTSDLDIENLTEKPNIEDLPYEKRYNMIYYAINENGSSTYKRGVEFGYNSPRFEKINTKITLSGAWFKTVYTNTDPFHKKPNVSLSGNDYPYVGIYKNDLGFNNSGLNYNLIADTYIPSLDMNISASFQGTLFNIIDRIPRLEEPYAYYGADGVVYEYTEEDKKDLYKQWLIRNVSLADDMVTKYTFDIETNLKVTKRIYKNIRTSLFVNKMFSYYKPYYRNGIKVERNEELEPYFGMELIYNF